MVDVSPADDAAVRHLSMLLHEAMAEMEPDPNKRTWYTLFKHMDDDGSGKITFHEFEDMVRNEVRLTRHELDEDSLRSVWRALDCDGSGYVTVGEFGASRMTNLLPAHCAAGAHCPMHHSIHPLLGQVNSCAPGSTCARRARGRRI